MVFRARYCYGRSVCPSVRPSHSGVYIPKRIHISSNSFRILIVFLWALYRRYTKFRGNPFSGGVFSRGRKILRFTTEIAVYLGDGTRWTLGYYGSWVADRSVSVAMTLSDLERGQSNFLAELKYARVVWPGMTKYGVVTQLAEKHLSKGPGTPPF